jgi:uncharacterized membrane protein
MNFCPNCGSSVKHQTKFCSNCGTAFFEVDKNIKENQNNPNVNKIKKMDIQSKRNKIINKDKNSNWKRNMFIAGIIILGAGFVFLKSLPTSSNPIIANQPKVSESIDYGKRVIDLRAITSNVENGKIIISLEDVKKKDLVTFNYDQNGARLPLLAYISPEGKLITAVSVCEPCNSDKFHIESEDMVCNTCGTRWDLNNLHGKSGGCLKYPPDPLPSIVTGDKIQIDETIVKNWTPRI